MKRMIGAVLAGSMMMIGASAFAGEVDRREMNQQARIEQGERTGQLTPREAEHLERREAKTERQLRRERMENGGRLTRAERRRINREENRSSRQIYADKHNGRRI